MMAMGGATRRQSMEALLSDAPETLTDLLGRLHAAGAWKIGQVMVEPDFSLHHVDDGDLRNPEVSRSPEYARKLAVHTDTGEFRPLKSAPNLRRGWVLRLRNAAEVRIAVDGFYPAALGNWLAWLRGELQPVPLRDTLERQTGMYRVVNRLTDDQADALIAKTCDDRTACLRRILWRISPDRACRLAADASALAVGGNEVPILCPEACNLLVAAGRPVAKENPP